MKYNWTTVIRSKKHLVIRTNAYNSVFTVLSSGNEIVIEKRKNMFHFKLYCYISHNKFILCPYYQGFLRYSDHTGTCVKHCLSSPATIDINRLRILHLTTYKTKSSMFTFEGKMEFTIKRKFPRILLTILLNDLHNY